MNHGPYHGRLCAVADAGGLGTERCIRRRSRSAPLHLSPRSGLRGKSDDARALYGSREESARQIKLMESCADSTERLSVQNDYWKLAYIAELVLAQQAVRRCSQACNRSRNSLCRSDRVAERSPRYFRGIQVCWPLQRLEGSTCSA